jgi:hypothetical protein
VEHSRSGRMKLNVSGSMFETTIATLIKFPGTFFYAAFVSFNSGDPAPLDTDGGYSIDRDGKHFGTILEFLRKGNARLPMDADDIDDLMEEVRYYMLDEPFQAALEAGGAIEGDTHTRRGRGMIKGSRPDFTRKEALQMVAAGHTNFSACNLSGLDLSGVNFRSGKCPNFKNAILHGTKMHRANLNEACFVEADLRLADMSFATVERAELNSANLTLANVSNANLGHAQLVNANLSNVDRSRVNLTQENLSGANLFPCEPFQRKT